MGIIELATLYLLISETSENVINKNYKLFEVTAFNDHERSVLYNFQMVNDTVIFLNGVTNEAAVPMEVMVNKCCIQIFENILQAEGIEYITYDDLSSIHHGESKIPLDKASDFMSWENIIKWVERYQKLYPILKKIEISNTYEKREMFILSIEKRKENPAVVIVGGEQGRDWMSPAIILNVINIFITRKSFQSLLELYTFYFLPIFNPDGYVFSMLQVPGMDSRFWNKNRKAFFPKKKCYKENGSEMLAVGVNIERNWYFGKSLGSEYGTECSSVYLGHKPLSEEEPIALVNFLNIHAVNLMAFFNVKGFGGRLITLPYSETTMHSHNQGVVMEMILSACEKVYQEHQSKYNYGSTARYFYNITGNSADWVKKHFNIPIVSTIHMKFNDETLPHTTHIEPLSRELITMINEILVMSKEIYGPLFNHQVELTEYTVIFVLTALFFIN